MLPRTGLAKASGMPQAILEAPGPFCGPGIGIPDFLNLYSGRIPHPEPDLTARRRRERLS